MRGWVIWILLGLGLAMTILIVACLLGLARLSPTVASRSARSALAVAVVAAVWDVAMAVVQPAND